MGAATVGGVTEDGVVNVSHVHADLVCTAGVELKANVRMCVEPFDDADVENGLADLRKADAHDCVVD